MHYYQFNIGDYASHTSYLSLLEDLAYRRLLDHYYLSELPYPNDIKRIARLIGMRDNVDIVQNIIHDFFVLDNDEWHNKRVDNELELYHSKAVTARNNGRKGGRPKKSEETQEEPNPNPEETQSVNLANPEITGSKANHKPLTINQEPVKIKRLDQSTTDLDLLFVEFWKSGIRKANKKKAESLFSNLLKKQSAPHKFTDMLIADIQERLRINQQGFSEMHPTTYLNGERWNDEKVIPNENPQRSTTKPALIDRVKANTAQRRKDRETEHGEFAGFPVGENDGDVRPQVYGSVRGDTRPDLGDVLEGDFREADG